MTVKGKRARITPDGRAHIATRALQYPRIQRLELAKNLQNELKAEGHDIPEIEVLERMISKFRNTPSTPLDDLWSLGSLVQYPIPPEAMPAIFAVQEFRLENQKEPLTVREALWVARLSAIITYTKALPLSEVLDFWVRVYSAEERLSAMLGTPLDTSKNDLKLRKHAEAYSATCWLWEDIEKAEGYEAAVSFAEDKIKLRSVILQRDALWDRLQTIKSEASPVKARTLLEKIQALQLEASELLIRQETRLRTVEERLLTEGKTLSEKYPDFPTKYLARLEASISETQSEKEAQNER